MDILIRMASAADAEELLAIYAPYVADTAITFIYDVPSLTEFSQKIHDTMQKYPFLVAVESGRIVGYTYASAFNDRAAYDWAVTTSIYLSRDHKRNGFGKKLYLALEDILKRQNIINLNASIAYTAAVGDAHLDNTSSMFHEHMGFKKVAHFTKCGYKFGAWYDMIWMEKIIGEHTDNPKPVIPVTMLSI